MSDNDRKCEFCKGPLTLTGHVCADKPELAVGQCQECDLKQVVDFAHVTLAHYGADDLFPEDLAAVRHTERAWNRRRVAKIREFIPDLSTKRVLDFGCGPGGFLEQAENLFAELHRGKPRPQLASAWSNELEALALHAHRTSEASPTGGGGSWNRESLRSKTLEARPLTATAG